MHIQSCLHPHVVRNKYTGDEAVCACGKCAACLTNRASMWTTRLDLETTCHKYDWFATFTYDEYHINQIVRLRYEDYKDGVAYLDSSTGEIYEFSHSSISRHNKSDFDYCKNHKVLNILSKPDVQKFIKRLRYYIKQLDNNAELRYYYTGEYGPSTKRAHGHGLFFFDSDIINENFADLLRKSWPYGVVFEPHRVSGSASHYVAAYINSLASLPSIYQHKQLRPFSLFSKCPSIGSLVGNLQDVQRLLDRKDTTVRVYSQASHNFVDVPLWRSLLDRHYPRIQRFSYLTVPHRIALYGLAETHYFEDKFRFAEFLYQRYIRSINGSNNFINRYLIDIVQIPKTSSFSHLHLASSPHETHINSLVRFCGILLRVRAQSSALGLSIKDYVIKMSEYYDTITSNKMKNWYEFQDEYFKTHPVKEFLLMDYAFVKRVDGKPLSTINKYDRFYLEFYGVIDDSTEVVHLSLDDSNDYRVFKARSYYLASNLDKSKKINDEIQYRDNKFMDYSKI